MKYVFSLIALVMFLSCGGQKEQPAASNSAPARVLVAPVQRSNVGGGKLFTGTVEAARRVTISTRMSGWIAEIPVEKGQRVGRGDLLIRLRDAEVKARVAQADAAIAAARAQFDNAQTNLKRIETLFKEKAATRKELDDMRTAFETARANLEAAQQQKQAALEMLAYTEIRSPIDGVVTRRLAEPGDLANPGQPLLVVEDTRQIKVVATVPETAVQLVEAGSPVQVQIPSAGSAWLDGRIARLVPGADPQTRQFHLEVLLANPGGEIQSGVFARVKLPTSAEAALLMPRKALFRRGQLEGVYTVQDSTARLRWIRTGRAEGSLVEVLSGLEEGELVVLEPGQQIRDGQPVVPVTAAPASAGEVRP